METTYIKTPLGITQITGDENGIAVISVSDEGVVSADIPFVLQEAYAYTAHVGQRVVRRHGRSSPHRPLPLARARGPRLLPRRPARGQPDPGRTPR